MSWATKLLFFFSFAECRLLAGNVSQSFRLLEVRGSGSATEHGLNEAVELKEDT